MSKKRIIALLTIFFGIYLIINFSRSIWDLWQKKELVLVEERKAQELQAKNEELKRKLELRKTPEAIEQEARDELNMVKPEETVVILPPITPIPSQVKEENLPNWKKWWRLFFR